MRIEFEKPTEQTQTDVALRSYIRSVARNLPSDSQHFVTTRAHANGYEVSIKAVSLYFVFFATAIGQDYLEIQNSLDQQLKHQINRWHNLRKDYGEIKPKQIHLKEIQQHPNPISSNL